MSRRRKQYHDQGGDTTAQPGGETTALPAVPDTAHPHYTPWPSRGEEPREHCPRCLANDCYVLRSQPGQEYDRRYWRCKRCGHGWLRRREPTHGPEER